MNILSFYVSFMILFVLGTFNLLDGDKIATLIAGYIGELVKQAGLQDQIKWVDC